MKTTNKHDCEINIYLIGVICKLHIHLVMLSKYSVLYHARIIISTYNTFKWEKQNKYERIFRYIAVIFRF